MPFPDSVETPAVGRGCVLGGHSVARLRGSAEGGKGKGAFIDH